MLTIFSCPKPFRGHINIIQRNAIKSWTLLRPRPEIILIGDEEGTAEICKEFGLRHVPKVERNEYGTPLVSSIFEIGQSEATNSLLCYVNADIILMSDFMEAIKQLRYQNNKFLLVGRRWDIELQEMLDYCQWDWENKLRQRLAKHGKLHPKTGLDYFIFPKGLWDELPSFALGRTIWDNWLIYKAHTINSIIIDATQVIIAVHQNHDFSHYPGGKEAIWKGIEARRNLELGGKWSKIFCLADVTHILTSQGIKRVPIHNRIWRRMITLPAFFRPARFLAEMIWIMVRPFINLNKNL